jgi:hypothetical protein
MSVDMSSDTLAERLRYLRRVAHMGARELDRLAGLQQGHTYQLESRQSGCERLEARTVHGIADVFGVSMEWLFLGRGRAPTRDAIRLPVARARRTALRESPRKKTGTND